MENSINRNKVNARRIESWLLNRIAMKGGNNVAKEIGVDKAQITRWKETWLPKMAMLLAVLEWGVVDDDMARLAREVAAVLTKKNPRLQPRIQIKSHAILSRITGSIHRSNYGSSRHSIQLSRLTTGSTQEQQDGQPENWLRPVVPERSKAVVGQRCLPKNSVGQPASNAARKPFTASFKGKQWHLQPGQLVVTAADLGLQLCDRKGNHASRDQVERMLQVFVKEGMISIDGEKQRAV